jgi:hypothetical protein
MKDSRASGQVFCQQAIIIRGTADQFGAARHVALEAVRQIVEHDYLPTPGQQAFGHMRSDESGTASNKSFH